MRVRLPILPRQIRRMRTKKISFPRTGLRLLVKHVYIYIYTYKFIITYYYIHSDLRHSHIDRQTVTVKAKASSCIQCVYYIFKDKSITVNGHSCSIVVPIPNSTLLSTLGSRNRTVIHNSLAQAIQMPSPALQKWIGLLEGLKHDRACLSCWLSAFQKYLTELLGFYLFFF